jgi:hypothetical protein
MLAFIVSSSALSPLGAQDHSSASQPTEVINRDADGGVTIRAIRLREPLTLDGILDEAIYQAVRPVDGFIQQDPREGERATEETDMWVLFDDHSIYVAARCWDSRPELIVANELRRDNVGLYENDNFAVLFDTFHDGRNAFIFHINPLAGLFDAQLIDENLFNRDWNTVWEAKTARFEKGWTLEIQVPFKSLRYRGGGPQVWGINARRIVRSKNEFTHITAIPASYGTQGILKVSSAATLVGLETPASSRNLEIKPYVRGDVTTDLEADPPYRNDAGGDAGFDVKYGITRGVTFDFTYNTDFAQVEVDEQQVNLTRFNLFYPEKREFFLEGQGLFNFGIEGGRGSLPPDNAPVVFFSRRIGLEGSSAVPIIAGGRLSGRVGDYSLGLLQIRTDDFAPADAVATDFSVLRVKRDVLERSNVGAILTRRAPQVGGAGENLVFGLDTDLNLAQDLRVNALWARSDTEGLAGGDEAYRARLNYNGDRYGAQLERMVVEDSFNPEIGFLSRENFERSFAQLRFSPRPRALGIRKLSFIGSFDYITDTAGTLETRIGEASVLFDYENSDQMELLYTRDLEYLPEPFEIHPGIVLPVGSYQFSDVRYRYRLGPHRKVSGDLSFQIGTFYSGERIEVAYRGRVELQTRLSLEPGVELNWVDLAEGSFSTELLTARLNYMMSPRLFLSALGQYNSSTDSLETNVRFRWEFQPGSDLFVVYTDARDTLDPLDGPPRGGFPDLVNRSFVVKLTRLFRF